MSKRLVIWLLLAVCCPDLSLATTANSVKLLSLQDAILLALRHNTNVRAAELQRVIDKFSLNVQQNEFEWRYALTGMASYNDTKSSGDHIQNTNYNVAPSASLRTLSGTQFTISSNNNVDDKHYKPGASLTLTQPLLRGFGSNIGQLPLLNAYDQEKLNKLALKQTIITTITTVAKDYLQLVLAKNALKTQQLALDNSIKTLQQYRLETHAGTRAGADKIQQEALIATQKLNVIQAQNTIAENKLTLARDLGLSPDFQYDVQMEISLPDKTIPTIAEGKHLILKNDIDYQSSLISYQIQTRQLQIARDNLRWQLNLTARSDINKSSLNLPNNNVSIVNGNSVQLNLTIPIDDKSLKQSVLNTEIQLQQAQIRLQQKAWLLTAGITNTLRNLAVQKEQMVLAIQARDLAQQSLNDALIKLRHGLVSTFETTSLQTALTEKELQVLNNQINYQSSLLDLQQTLGTTLSVWNIAIRY